MVEYAVEPVGGVARLALEDWTVATRSLRAADRDPATSAALIDAADGVRHADGVDGFLQRLAAVDMPTVALVGGGCDASALAVLAAVSLGFVTDDVAVSVDATTILELGLTSSLPMAVGAAQARVMLFGGACRAGPLDAAALRACGLGRGGPGDSAEAALRLADDPSAALLVRSLRVAARSSVEQARHYDAELRRIE